jgi:hypothetical protein
MLKTGRTEIWRAMRVAKGIFIEHQASPRVSPPSARPRRHCGRGWTVGPVETIFHSVLIKLPNTLRLPTTQVALSLAHRLHTLKGFMKQGPWPCLLLLFSVAENVGNARVLAIGTNGNGCHAP